MSLVEVIVAAIIIASLGFLITYVTSFLYTGLPTLLVTVLTVCFALKVIIFIIGRRE